MEVRQIITQIYVQLPIGRETKKEKAWCIMWEQNTWSQVGGGSGNLDWGDQGELPQGSKLLLSSKWTKERLGGGQWQRAVNLSIFLQEGRYRPAIRKAGRARTPQAREGAHADPPPGMCSPLGPSRVCPGAHCSLTASLSPYLPQPSSLSPVRF